MKKYALLALLFVLVSLQAKEPITNAPDKLNLMMDSVRFLCFYDYISFSTSDSVNQVPIEIKKQLGKEWFCIPDSNIWHAYYGRLEEDGYHTVLHYTVRDDKTIARDTLPCDTALLTRYARALKTTFNHYFPQVDTFGIFFNQYIRENNDGTFQTIALPALQPGNVALYGAEFIYTISPDGRTILNDHSYFPSNFMRGFQIDPQQEIWLDYTTLEEPTLGALFFGWYYKTAFKGINLETAHHIMAPIQINNSWSWYTIDKPKQKGRHKKQR